MKVLFYYLSAFSNTGGIEKFNRCFIKALSEITEEENIRSSVLSVYDYLPDKKYAHGVAFNGCRKQKIKSIFSFIGEAWTSEVVIIGHINLWFAAALLHVLRPKCTIITIAHGIEVWGKLFFLKKWVLRFSDAIFSVSTYTKNQLSLNNRIDPTRIRLFPNTIDPFFTIPASFEKPAYLLHRYNLSSKQPVVFTLARLSSSEGYKGYDKVIAALPLIRKNYPDVMYILAGKYDESERRRIEQDVATYGVMENVRVVGFISDSELEDHYRFADVFIMPSRGEGFGIVFLEALACGTKVIGGNEDGTVDALQNGHTGCLVNPADIEAITQAIIKQLSDTEQNNESLQSATLRRFAFDKYKTRFKDYLLEYAT